MFDQSNRTLELVKAVHEGIITHVRLLLQHEWLHISGSKKHENNQFIDQKKSYSQNQHRQRIIRSAFHPIASCILDAAAEEALELLALLALRLARLWAGARQQSVLQLLDLHIRILLTVRDSVLNYSIDSYSQL